MFYSDHKRETDITGYRLFRDHKNLFYRFDTTVWDQMYQDYFILS